MRKTDLFWVLTVIVVFILGFWVGNTLVDEKEVEMVSDATYSSLLGSLEEIPNVDSWSIERLKYSVENYNRFEWSVKVRYGDGTSIHFDERKDVQAIMQDLRNLNEANLYTD